MPIDNYLCEIDNPHFVPGPYSLRLKYELKKYYYERKPTPVAHFIYRVTILSLLVVCGLFVLKPYTATKLNALVFGEKQDLLDMFLLAEKDIDISNFPPNVRTFSTDSDITLPFIEVDKPYLIHKFVNHDNKTLFYISEVKSTKSTKILY